MKKKLLIGTMAGLVAVWAGAQANSGGTAGSAGSAASAGSATSANVQEGTTGANAGVNSSMNNSVNSSVNTTTPNQNSLPPGLQRDQLPPGLAGRDQLPPGLQRGNSSQFPPRAGQRVGATNNNPTGTTPLAHSPGNTPEPVAQTGDRSGVVSSGAVTGATNNTTYGTVGGGVVGGVGTGVAVGTLSNRVTSSSNVTPTGSEDSRTYTTNQWRRMATNSISSTQVIREDQVATDEDRLLLVQLRRQATPVITRYTGSVGAGAWAPVHFDIRNGIVTMVGTVPSIEQREQLVTVVEQVPGVVRVIDRLQLGSSSAGNVAVGGSADTNEVDVGGASGGSNVISNSAPLMRPGGFGSATNLPPTSSTNANRVYQNRQGLPPGLEKRDELPPGLRNRETLPPGLQRRVTPDGNNNPDQGNNNSNNRNSGSNP